MTDPHTQFPRNLFRRDNREAKQAMHRAYR